MSPDEVAADPPTDETTAENAPAEEAPAERPRRRLSFSVVVQAGVVVGLVGGVVGLLFTLVPGLKPEKAAQPTANLEVAAVDDRAMLRDYLAAEGIDPGEIAPSVLRRVGVLTTIRLSSTGLEGKELPLVVSLTSRDTSVIACKHTYRLKAGKGPPPTFRAWAAFPTRARPGESFNLHVTLFPPNGKPPPLDAEDRTGIAGLDRPQPGPANANLPVDLC